MIVDLKAFKPLKNYESYYSIASDGRIFHLKKERLLTPFKNKIGKLYVTLIVKGRKKGKSINELIESTFGEVLQDPKWKPISKTRTQPNQESIPTMSDILTAPKASKFKWKPI